MIFNNSASDTFSLFLICLISFWSCLIFAFIDVLSSFAASASGIGNTNNPKASSRNEGFWAFSMSVSEVFSETSRFSRSCAIASVSSKNSNVISASSAIVKVSFVGVKIGVILGITRLADVEFGA